MKRQIVIFSVLVLIAASVYAAVPEVFFSPDKENENIVAEFVGGTKHELLIAAYSLTDTVIAGAIKKVKASGKTVELVCDKANFKKKNDFCKSLGGKPDKKSGLMHNKVMIRDRECFITGSFNFTENAVHNNRENFMIYCDKDTAAQYVAEFQNIRDNNT